MKILIDGQTLGTPEINRGIGVYFLKTIEQILATNLADDFFIVSTEAAGLTRFSPWAQQRLESLSLTSAQRANTTSYTVAINELIQQYKIDLYWSPNPLMLNVFLPSNESSDCTFAATIFDLIPAVMETHFRKHWPARMINVYQEKLRVLEDDYDLFLHISEQTRSDFLRLLRVNDQRHVVTPLAADDAFRPYPFPKTPAGTDYVLYPGGFDPRKNMDRALEAFAAMKEKHSGEDRIAGTELVIVCHKDAASETELRKRARKLGIDSHLQLTGFVSDAELVSLYQKARCLFFPSLYEGFGLPVLEGLACGLPVAASNVSSIPEIAGNQAVYFDPLDVESMAEGLYRALHEPIDLASRLRRQQHTRAFSWQRTAAETLRGLSHTNGASSDLGFAPVVAPLVEDESLEIVDVRKLMSELSVEELCRTAEEFFARLDNPDYLHAKPFAAINETPELLVCFAQVLHGLRLLPDMTILDFGAGSCWTSRFLSQLGLRVIAHDVSASALRIGRELYSRWPVAGDQPDPQFLLFDGRKIDLPDESVDRISCWDAFHHVPNQETVLREMARVLKPGGIAGFSEPGPEHSKSPQSQYEMRTNKVIENDIHVREIWDLANAAGFTDLKLSFFNPFPVLLSLEAFEAQLDGKHAGGEYLQQAIEQMHLRRIFFLHKGEYVEPADSRRREGLLCELKVELESNRVGTGRPLQVKAVIKNSGNTLWLPTTARVGAVHFGIHLFDADGKLLNLDYFREKLTPGDGRAIYPGETVELRTAVPLPAPGKYIFQFDLVSEAVCWFEHNGSPRVTQNVEVLVATA